MQVDLHMHSSFSDGRYTPRELVQAAIYHNLGVIAITDHDSWNGYEEAQLEAEKWNQAYAKLLAAGIEPKEAVAEIKAQLASAVEAVEFKASAGAPASCFVSDGDEVSSSNLDTSQPLLRVVPGVELSAQYEERAIHILGYHVDRECQALAFKMDELRYKREHRLELMLEKCREQGMDLTIDAVDPEARAVGRPHVAKAMVAKGYVQTVEEAFEKYLHWGGPCYVQQPKLTPEEAVDLLHQAGGLAILAHPSEILNPQTPEYLVSHVPFDGLEIWHPSVREHDDTQKWLALAEKYHLLLSGGSDFHGIPDRYPAKLGLWRVDYDHVAAVLERSKE